MQANESCTRQRVPLPAFSSQPMIQPFNQYINPSEQPSQAARIPISQFTANSMVQHSFDNGVPFPIPSNPNPVNAFQVHGNVTSY